ncbi:MAG: EF-hand domain-containing protein [Bacteroidetes bacterium]|nr:MAG: EF-hand domain-containing protein [Bacteroidota bacterium]
MKRKFRMGLLHSLMVFSLMILMGVGTSYAQTGQGNNNTQRFTQCDRNGDGFISNTECQNVNFANFDRNGDGLLNRNEYRKLRQQQNNFQKANRNANRSNRGQGMNRGTGNAQRQGFRNPQGNGQRLRDGSCGNTPRNTGNRSGNGRGRRG